MRLSDHLDQPVRTLAAPNQRLERVVEAGLGGASCALRTMTVRSDCGVRARALNFSVRRLGLA